MHKTARQKYVIDILSEQGQAVLLSLQKSCRFLLIPIRRDLTDLEKQGSGTEEPRRGYRA